MDGPALQAKDGIASEAIRTDVFDVKTDVLQRRPLHFRGQVVIKQVVKGLWIQAVADALSHTPSPTATLTGIGLGDPAHACAIKLREEQINTRTWNAWAALNHQEPGDAGRH
jgi:hypothetical protein